jgi:hypothetical protein
MNKWYVSVDNKAKGPYSDLQVREKIKIGELKPETLSYKEGEADWLPINKQDIWTPGFVPKHPVETKNSKDWVLLVESPLKKGDFEQAGPFTDAEVKEKIEIGEVNLRDFCWKPGMSDWKPLFETYELGLPRKEKISFVEDKVETEKSSNLTSEVSSVKLSNQMPEFIMPDEELPVEEPPLKQKAKRMSSRLLPPLKKTQEPKDIVSYLVLVAALFLGAFYIGYQNNQAVLRGVQNLGQSLVTLSRSILPASPTVSYVFLRELPISKESLLIKTDASKDVPIKIQIFSEKGKRLKTLEGRRSFSLQTNKNGEAFFNLREFKLVKGQTYLVTAQIGSLKAKKTYTY